MYTFGNTGVLACWDAATGKPVWKVETLADPKKDNLFFGLSASPLVVGDNVVVQGGGNGSKGLKAYDRKTGKPAWKAGDDPASYAAPVLLDKDIVVLTGANLMAVSPDRRGAAGSSRSRTSSTRVRRRRSRPATCSSPRR